MIIEISSSGGFGGLAAAGLNKRIDLDQQAPALRQEICEMFEPEDLSQLEAKAPNAHSADGMVYRITLTDQAARAHVYTIPEDKLPPEMLDLIDAM